MTAPRPSERAVAAAVALDRISQTRIGERLAEVIVGDEVVDLRRFQRDAPRRGRRAS